MQATRFYTVLFVSFFLSATADSLTGQPITHVPLYTFHGDSEGDRFGTSVSGVGDVNGDGIPDMIVGAPRDDNNGDRSGSARVLSGSDGSVLYNFDGDSALDFFGTSVSGAGDVNGDGRADLIVGGPSSGSGIARVFSGSDGNVLYNFNGNTGDFFGASVSGAGDVNGDGRADLIVGAPFYDDRSGTARVLSGSDGSVLYNFNGDTGDFFGASVSGAGDVNGDGRADLIVGAFGDDISGSSSNGSASVLSGSDGSVLYNFVDDFSSLSFGTSVSGAGDVNGDGIPDLIVGGIHIARVFSGSDGRVLHSWYLGTSNGRRVSSAGDVNGDGKADFIVGTDTRVRVFSGSDGSVLYNFAGDNFFDDFGSSVSDVGDVNGDGIADFFVGAATGGANQGGYARLYVSQIVELLLGDCNQDGVLNFLDVAPFISTLSTGGYLATADINVDAVVNFSDISPFIEILSGR